jgi:hypothetical protein
MQVLLMRMELDANEVKGLFERCSHQDDVLEGLYRMVLPEWDRIEYVVEGRPHIGEVGWNTIFSLFQAFDEMHHGEFVFPGYMWLSLGFQKDESLDSWEVDTSEVRYILKR